MSKITQWEIEVRKIRKMRKCSDKQARKILRKILTAGIRKELERRAERLNVSREKARELEGRVRSEMELPSLESIEALQAAATAMAADGNLSSFEQKALEQTSKKLGIQDEERLRIQKDAIKFNKYNS